MLACADWFFTILFLLVILVSGCAGPNYVPEITLRQTGPIIEPRAEFHNLYLAYGLLSGKDIFGLDAPKSERGESSELTREVESELVKELDTAGVF